MDVSCDAETKLVHKRARSAEERHRLRHEATVLGAVPHPGVVQVVATDGRAGPDCLLLRHVSGGDLTSLGRQSTEVVAGLGAAIATTLADLHDLGVSHGSIQAGHVLLDEDGRPVLCSFGRAEVNPPTARDDRHRREDVRALARLLLEQMAPGIPTRAARALRLAAGPGRQRRCLDARWLARQLISCVPGARLPDRPGAPEGRELGAPPGAATPAGRRRRDGGIAASRRFRPFRWPAGRALAGVICVASAGVAVVALGSSPVRRPAPRVTVACPASDDGCGPVPTPEGFLAMATGRYQLAAPGDVTVLGRWRCTSSAVPAVLRPATGQVWTFAAWPPPGRPQTGRLAGQVAGAWSLRVLPDRSGCDRLEVETRGGPPVTVEVAAP
jgi:hypothetical protein